MLFALDKRRCLEITEEDVRQACALADCYARETTRLVNEEMTFCHGDRQRKKVEDAIKSAGQQGVSRSKLLRATRIGVKELTPILETLTASESIVTEECHNEGLTGAAGSRTLYLWNYKNES
jgi:hypothetical protein